MLVTHNHYDHMDVDTIGRLWQRFRPRIVTPLGNDTILKRDVPGLAASVVDWDDAIDLGDGVTVHVEPTLHWSARGAGDRMHALWASFVVRGRRTQGLLRRRQRLRRRGDVRPRAPSAIPASRWPCCRSAPTSRAGSCATTT